MLRCFALSLGLLAPTALVAQTTFQIVPPVNATRFGVDHAYDATNDLYLVVWNERTSTDTIFAQRVTSAGVVAGTPIRLGNGRLPKVASVNQRDAFVVMWRDGSALRARGVYAASGLLTNQVTVSTGSTSHFGLAGEATTQDDDAIAVWLESSTIRGAQLQFTVVGTLQSLGSISLATQVGTSISSLHVAKSGGPARRLLAAWTESSSGGRFILGVVTDMNLNILDSRVNVTPFALNRPTLTGLDGDGTTWVAAYEQDEPLTFKTDLMCRSIYYNPRTSSASAGGAEFLENDPNDDELVALVSWVGGSAITVFLDSEGSQYALFRKAVDPFTCTPCGSESQISNVPQSFAIASELSGGGTGDGALQVWVEESSGSYRILGRSEDPRDGEAVSLGGGCGDGGEAFATCAKSGNNEFRLRTRGAEPGVSAFVLVSPDRIDAPCAGCRLIPDPMRGVSAGPIPTSSRGMGELHVPLGGVPRGTEVLVQWYVLEPNPFCTQLGGSFSTALKVTIE